MRGVEFYFYADRVCNPSCAYSICSHTRHYLGGDAYYEVFLRWPILTGIMRFPRISSVVTPSFSATFISPPNPCPTVSPNAKSEA